MQKLKLNISWMHCSSCSKLIQEALNKNEFITNSQVNFWNNKALVEFDETNLDKNDIISIIKKAWYKASTQEIDTTKEKKAWLNKSIFWLILSIPMVVFMVYDFVKWLPFYNILMPYMAFVSLFLATILQFSIWLDFYKWAIAALKQKTANMYSLIAIWTTVAFLYSVYSFLKFYLDTWSILGLNWMKIEWIYFEVSSLLLTFVCFWKYLETRAKAKTTDAISKLILLAPKTAFVKIDWEFIEQDIEKIKVWDIILVKAWDKIPVDGKVISGIVTVDESMLTWESLPVDKNIWELVLAWTLNKFTNFEIQTTQIWAGTMLSQIINLLEEASLSKSNLEWFADRVSKIFVPTVIILSILTFVVWYFWLNWTFENALLLACSVVVIACPCALWLATPTAVIVWTGLAARFWILIKWWNALEKANYITAIALDKTWTITTWNPTLQDIVNFSKFPIQEILKIAYSLENNSNHPISKAIINYSKDKNITLINASNFEVINWKWIIWEIENEFYFIGNLSLVIDKNISLNNEIQKEYKKLLNEWKTVLFLWNKSEILALISVSDEIKTTSKNAINILKNMWIEVFMITWDNKKAAEYIWALSWIDKSHIFAEVLPQDKWNIIKNLQNKWFKVAMVWDWINDSIAMANSDLAISMWSWNDVALESADIVLMKNDLNDIIHSIDISKKTVSKIKQNLFFSLFYNTLWIPIAAWVLLWFWLFLKPELAWLAMALSSVLVIFNSLLLKLSIKYKSFSIISLWVLLVFFTALFIWFAWVNKTDKFETVYTKNNNVVLEDITKFVLNSKNKINISEVAPKIFMFTNEVPQTLKIKSWTNKLNENEVIIWYMEAQMMIDLWLIKWVWSEIDNFFWVDKIKVVWILSKTDTILDDVHIMNLANYEKLIWDSESLKFFETPDHLALRTFYLYDEKNIPAYFTNNLELKNLFLDKYLKMYIWFLDANMMVNLWLVKGLWEKLDDFFGNNVVYFEKLKKTYTSYDMMHFVSKKYFKISN